MRRATAPLLYFNSRRKRKILKKYIFLIEENENGKPFKQGFNSMPKSRKNSSDRSSSIF
jgi:hypothetical protein